MIANILLTFSVAIFLGFTFGKIVGAIRKAAMREAAETLREKARSMRMEDAQGTGPGAADENSLVLLESIKAYDLVNDPVVKSTVLDAMHLLRRNSQSA